MRFDLLIAPDSGKALHEIARGYDLRAELPNQLDRTRVDTRHVRNSTIRRIFHGQSSHAADDPAESGFELSPPGASLDGTRYLRQHVRLDRVHQPPRRSLGWNQIKPSACGEVAAPPRKPRHVQGDRIDAVEIVEQPAVQVLSTESRLNSL